MKEFNQVPNPIPMRTRGRIYVASIIMSGVALVVTAVLTTAGLEQWLPVVVAAVSGMSFVSSSLARDNLTVDPSDPARTGVDE